MRDSTRFSSAVRGPKLVVFLGSSLGNYDSEEAHRLLCQFVGNMSPDDRFLLGTDLAKDGSILEPAYDDRQGVTARFNRNLLVRINRELGADFVVEQFQHKSVYRADLGRVEMHLVSMCDQTVSIPGAGLEVELEAGESIHTENSHKYTIEKLQRLAESTGFAEESAWSDSRDWFRVQRWQTRSSS